ncbi:MAG: Omp28-related outer membrane protein [Bacteroidota bacterium]
MKKIFTTVLGLMFGTMLSAQIFSDDFESYNAGDYLGVVSSTYWGTWSGAAGSNEDVQIGTANASSGTNSIYFSSAASNGGPQDVVLDFQNTYTSGIFEFEADFYVESGRGAYWNFQAVPLIGTTWALNCLMENGTIDFDGLVSGQVPEDTWFTLRVEANLTLGLWQFWVDGVHGGLWNNPINSIASLDLFPFNGHGFYVDDVSFDHTPYTLPANNAGASGINMIGAVESMTVFPKVRVTNAGTGTISSFDVSLNYNGTTHVENISGLTLASLDFHEIDFSNSFVLVPNTNVATLIVSNVNGNGQDDDINDDTLTLNVNPIVPAPGKTVLVEEATGTWCQWCPRGAVYMERSEIRYGPVFAGVAVHNGDPMADATYDAGIQTIISGYPSATVDRLRDVDPSGMRPDIEMQLVTPPTANFVNGASWDAQTRELTVSVTTTFQQAASGDWRIACILTEDSVTGTDPGYNQSNAYAGGGSGPMGGYENLPASVPASMMVYDHVARAISPSFIGQNNSFPANIPMSATYTHNFSYTLPADWDEDKIHIIGTLVNPNGQIDNSRSNTIAEAVANGLIIGVDDIETNYLAGPDEMLMLYPNPATGLARAELRLQGVAEVTLSIFDLSGQQVAFRDYGELDGMQTLPLALDGFAQGLYVVRASVNGKIYTKKLAVE